MKAFGAGVCFFIVLVILTGCTSSGGDGSLSNSFFMKISASSRHQDNLPDTFLAGLLAKHPGLNALLSKKEELGIQIIYTQIDRGKKEKDKIKFTQHEFNLNPERYFYPASTVKLPVAILALQKLNELKIAGLDRNTTMITGEKGDGQTAITNDPSAPDGRPTVAHYIKKILLVSDNDAFNRLYEFLGQEYINNSLHHRGYKDVQIIHRLSIPLSEEQNRHSNPVSFIDSTGRLLYRKHAEKSKLVYTPRDTKMGRGYLQGGKLINEPFDFSKKNLLPLQDLHDIVRSILFPDAVPREQQFNLAPGDYDFLRLYMSMRPGEAVSPVYNPADYWDNYVKMLFYGAEKTTPGPGIRIFNKTGTAYGFLVDACYFTDTKNNIEFLLSAVIYCNSDGIFNDDKYDYSAVGYPFLKDLGRVIYEYELTRPRKYPPDLSSLQFSYSK